MYIDGYTLLQLFATCQVLHNMNAMSFWQALTAGRQINCSIAA
jgi:hypothetical protein